MRLKRRPFIILQIICLIGWLTLFIAQKANYFEGYPTTQSELFGDLKGIFVIISFLATIINFNTTKNE